MREQQGHGRCERGGRREGEGSGDRRGGDRMRIERREYTQLGKVSDRAKQEAEIEEKCKSEERRERSTTQIDDECKRKIEKNS